MSYQSKYLTQLSNLQFPSLLSALNNKSYSSKTAIYNGVISNGLVSAG